MQGQDSNQNPSHPPANVPTSPRPWRPGPYRFGRDSPADGTTVDDKITPDPRAVVDANGLRVAWVTGDTPEQREANVQAICRPSVGLEVLVTLGPGGADVDPPRVVAVQRAWVPNVSGPGRRSVTEIHLDTGAVVQSYLPKDKVLDLLAGRGAPA